MGRSGEDVALSSETSMTGATLGGHAGASGADAPRALK